jgi:hypothetical protein
MYHEIDLSGDTPILVGSPLSVLPTEVRGLAQSSLDDLSAALDPCPAHLDGRGFWPVVDAPADLDPWQELAAEPAYEIDAENHQVLAVRAAVDRDLDALKAEKRVAATAKFRAIIAAGKVIGGATIDLTSEGFARLEQAKAVIVAGGGPISAVTIRGEPIDLPDVDTVTAVIGAARAHWLAAAARERALYDAVDEAANSAAVAAIDEASGWPS